MDFADLIADELLQNTEFATRVRPLPSTAEDRFAFNEHHRYELARAAMIGLLASGKGRDIAKRAVEYADEVISELEKEPDDGA